MVIVNSWRYYFLTSEVLIMTPSAVAMAADSIVTINGNKTYEGVNKLFMLSKNPPMGIMVYNNANFITIPFETLIKDFRYKFKNDKSLKTVDDFRNKFKEYLETEHNKNKFPMMSLQDKINIFMEHMGDEVSAFDENTIEEWFINNQDLNVFEDYKDIIFTDNDSLENFNNIICDIAPEFLDLDKKSKFKRILRNIFVQIMVLENYTGVAIVGFERDKLFPSCTLFKIRYIYDDKFIFDEITNDEVGKKAVIFAPLAQTDVIESFFTSMGMDIEKHLKMFFYNIIEGYNYNLKELIKSEDDISQDDIGRIINILDKVQNKHPDLNNSFGIFIDDIKRNNRKPILRSIQFLAKDELSNLAESLINLTSLKRKVQDGLETVGGDVDVAIITKGDGFIWTKRKHYFKPELNPHYFDKDS